MKSNMKEEEGVCSEEGSTSTSGEGGEEEEDEEELALFKDMKARERQEFLHRFSDDSDESISIKLGSFSSFKFYMSGKHGDPLNADTGRTDYNWLLTPPATPLFPTLDKKTPHVEISERSKLQSKPRTTSPRISRTERSPRRTRSSSSTQHSSLFSSSCSISSHSRGRATSSTSRGNLKSHHLTSTVRSSTDTINSSAASARSSTPSSKISSLTFQRSSTGSTSSHCSSLIQKAAPSLQGKNHLRSSVQQQVQHMTIPRSLSEPPPNLITRTSDNNVFLKRGSSPVSSYRGVTEKKSRRQSASPASSYRGETEKKSRRQSASPTFLRNGSSSENHDRQPHVSKNKGRRMSSSTDVRTDPSLKIKQRSYTSNRVQSPSKGARKSESASIVSNVLMSKRCPNTRTQQRNSQSMFRPLLSDLPVTSFYAKKATRVLYQGNIDNSSVSTSGNGCIAPVTKVPDNSNKDLENESSKCSFTHDQVKIEDIEKTEVESQVKYVVREESTNQDSQYVSAQTHQCLLDDRTVQSALGVGKPDMIRTSQGGLRSEFQSKESCACCRDSDDGQSCVAGENVPVQDVHGNVLLEGKAELCSRLVDSFKLSINTKDNLQDQEADTRDNFDSSGNVLYLTSSCKGLNNDKIASSSKLNDMDTHKLECHVLRQVNISRPHLEDLACKSDVQVTPGILTTPRDQSGIHEAGVLSEGAAIEGSIVFFADIVSDRCSGKYKAGENAVTGTEGQTNPLKHKDIETYSGKEKLLLLQESLFASQKDEKPIEGIAQTNNQDTACLSKDILILETQEQKYCCSKSPELFENSGCLLFERNRVDSVTQASPAPCKQAKECADSGGDSMTFEIGNSSKAYVNASPSNLETEMEHPISSTLEGNACSDGNSMLHVPEVNKAQQVHVSQGDKAFHGNSPRRCLSKSLTLEEAADTVLFCNSIVHDLVYKSTMIAMQKEIVGVTPIPIVTSTVGMAQAKRRNFCRGAGSQRMLTYKSINSRKTVAHLHTPSSRIETTIEDQQPVMHVSVGERNELPKPEKVKSKCHCTIL
ncbi:hypothetical protein SUGI_0923380 [Cryptomeria japonica]|nr:hypothetical protein SUGI_0923380 [Cryptomeria japonica]